MEKTYNLELTEKEKGLINDAIWLYYHKTMEDIKDKNLEKWEKNMMCNDLNNCENLIKRMKKL